MPDNNTIGIVGLGPVGMILAAHLQEAGFKVIICDIDRIKINQIRNDGIVLTNVFEKTSKFSHICSSVEEMADFKPDILFFATKVNMMPVVLQHASALKACHPFVVSAQNGIDSEQFLCDFFGREQTLRMVINYAGNLKAKNIVRATFFNPPNYIAALEVQGNTIAEQLATALSAVHLQTEMADNATIQEHVWEKTILNSSLSALCAVGRLTMADVMGQNDTRDLTQQTIEECQMVAKAHGYDYGSDFVDRCMAYLGKAGHHFPSLAVDMINNRPTEIDYFNGKIVEYGLKHKVPTPINLSFTNTIRAMTRKHIAGRLSTVRPERVKTSGDGRYYLGIDMGSAYTKISVIGDDKNAVYHTTITSQNNNQAALQQAIIALRGEFDIACTCATGYGRRHLPEADVVKTEINCAAAGADNLFPNEKNIIDIGGEDIKVIHTVDGRVEHFYMNDKCAAGTGSFIVEISERAEISISEMSRLAAQSTIKRELNSFCAVFAKTEIMNWLFDGMPVTDIARGVYLSIANRVAKLRLVSGLPVYMIGGVIQHHPYLRTILEERFNTEVLVPENPQHIVSSGAALLARQAWKRKKLKETHRA